MNKNGNPGTLVPSHPGNTNAAKHGVYSERRIQPRADEIFDEFVQAFEFSPSERLAVREIARSAALLEAIDKALDESGLTNRRGEAHSLLNYRSRTSRQLQRWMTEVAPTIERQVDGGPLELTRDDYVRELKRIAAGKDRTASAHDKILAIKELMRLDAPAKNRAEAFMMRIVTEDDVTEDDGTKRIEYADDPPVGDGT